MKIDKSEVLRYLGYRGGFVEEEIYGNIDECTEKILKLSTPRSTYKIFEIDENCRLSSSDYRLDGEDIKIHLRSCRRCVLMAATIGIGVENYIKQLQITDMAKAVIADSCATAAIESYCDEVESKIKEAYPYITERFSPGYGDMPIEMQKTFAVLLDTPRKIGLTVTEAEVLLPRKSVTAVIGISETEIKETKRSCESCNLKNSCSYRREGKNCGK